jgi:hypothetical protein
MVKCGTEMKYTFWAVLYVLFKFGILSGSKDTNMEALLSEQLLSMASYPRRGYRHFYRCCLIYKDLMLLHINCFES